MNACDLQGGIALPPPRVLLVEHEQETTRGTLATLLSLGRPTARLGTLEDAAAAPCALLVVDLEALGPMPPRTLRELRQRGIAAPLLVTGWANRPEQRIELLNAGADDCLGRPFAQEELAARCRALLRRGQGESHTQSQRIGSLRFNLSARRLWRDERRLELTAREYQLFELMAQRFGQVIRRSSLLRSLGDDNDPLSDNGLDIAASRLRSKLAGSGVQCRTIRGEGYVLERESGSGRA